MTAPSKRLRMDYSYPHTSGQFLIIGCSKEIPRLTHYFSLANIFYVMDLYFHFTASSTEKIQYEKLIIQN